MTTATRRFELPPSYRRQLQHGNDRAGKWFKKSYGPDKPWSYNRDGVMAFHYDPGMAAWLTCGMVRNGWTGTEIREAHLNPHNLGTYWVRAQEDPSAASEVMIAQQPKTLRPMISNRDQVNILAAALLTGEVFSKKKLRDLVGNAKEGQTDKLVQMLVDAGVVRDETEPHGLVTWHKYSTQTSDAGAYDRAVLSYNRELIAAKFKVKHRVSFDAVKLRRLKHDPDWGKSRPRSQEEIDAQEQLSDYL